MTLDVVEQKIYELEVKAGDVAERVGVVKTDVENMLGQMNYIMDRIDGHQERIMFFNDRIDYSERNLNGKLLLFCQGLRDLIREHLENGEIDISDEEFFALFRTA